MALSQLGLRLSDGTHGGWKAALVGRGRHKTGLGLLMLLRQHGINCNLHRIIV
jgi:hypothetical protein